MSDLRKAAQDVPYPGMDTAFESHFGQSWTDRDWRNEASTWAAAWKAATRAALATCPDCGKPTPEGSVHTCSPQKPDPMQQIHAFGREQDSLEDAKQRLLEIMRKNGLATGHGDTLTQVIDALEVELTDTLAAARGEK